MPQEHVICLKNLISSWHCLYWAASIIFCLYYVLRGVMEKNAYLTKEEKEWTRTKIEDKQKIGDTDKEAKERTKTKDVEKKSEPPEMKWTTTQKVVIIYIQEVIFRVVITFSSFISLSIAYDILSSLKINEIGPGTAILLISLLLWGVLGISGYLTLFIVNVKIPGAK